MADEVLDFVIIEVSSDATDAALYVDAIVEGVLYGGWSASL